MSRRSSQGNKVLLDTSFLLPVLGFDTSERVMRAFHKLGSYEIYYNDISLLEAFWKILKVVKGSEEELSRVEEGVTAIRESMRYVPIDSGALGNAVHMYELGHKDMIDNLLYSIAVSNELRLLTVDEKLVEFVKKHGLDKDKLVLPEQLK